MNTQAYQALQSERGRRGGLKAAETRRAKRLDEARRLDRLWPRCRDCGARTHLGLCLGCAETNAFAKH